MNEEENKLWMFDVRLQNILRRKNIESVEDLREFIVDGFESWGCNPFLMVAGVGRRSTDAIMFALAEWEPKQIDDAKTLDKLNTITMEELNRVGMHVRAAQEIIKKHEAKRMRITQ